MPRRPQISKIDPSKNDQSQDDPYVKKTIAFNFSRQQMRFLTSQDLFSSFDVDVGSRFLLRTLVTKAPGLQPESILDLGCGYGPLGLSLKQRFPAADVHLTDRDALAVDFAARNADLNDVHDGVQWYGSLAYDDLRRERFDLIVSNIPAKAGEPVIRELLLGGEPHLAPGGMMAIVVVSDLEADVEALLTSDAITIVHRERRPGHAVFHYRFTSVPESDTDPTQSERTIGLDRGVYWRDELSLTGADDEHDADALIRTAYGLPDFDTLGYASELLIEAFPKHVPDVPRRVLMLNPGQGHVPVAFWKAYPPASMMIADRDLLALRVTQVNLLRQGCPEDAFTIAHRPEVRWLDDEAAKPFDIIGGVIRDKEGPDSLALTARIAVEHLTIQGKLLLAGDAAAINRIALVLSTDIRLDELDRTYRRGQNVLVIRRKR